MKFKNNALFLLKKIKDRGAENFFTIKKKGTNGLPRDQTRALQYYEQAANLGFF